jgi:hypothetical protein
MKQIITTLKFEHLSVRDTNITHFLDHIQSEPIDAENFINYWIHTCIHNHPLQTLFNKIETQNLISDVELNSSQSYLKTHLHLAILFEALSVSMLNSKTFSEDIYKFIIKLRSSIQPGNPIANFFLASGSDFNFIRNLKAVAVDPVMPYGAFSRTLNDLGSLDEIEQKSQSFIEKYKLRLWNAKINPHEIKPNDSIKNVAINMLWAICNESETIKSSRLNAHVGCGLIALMEKQVIKNQVSITNVILPQGTSLLSTNKYSLLPDLKIDIQPKVVHLFDIEKEWIDLYTSWDLLFLIEQFGEEFLPIKLLGPAVLGAIPKHYFESRVFLLFLMGNLFQSCQIESNLMFKHFVKLENSVLIKEEWAKINLQLVNDLLRKNGCEKECAEIYEEIIGKRPSVSLITHLAHFAFNYKNFSLTQK